MEITEHGLKAIGFKKFEDKELLIADFQLVLIYSIQGFILQEKNTTTNIVENSPLLKAAIGTSVNSLSQKFFNDDYIDDEKEWTKEKKCTSPYLMIVIGPSNKKQLRGGWRKYENKILITYNCFKDLKEELSEKESNLLTASLPSINVTFSTLPHPVRLKLISREFIGTTESGQSFQDLRFGVSGNLSLSKPIDLKTAEILLNDFPKIAKELESKNSVHLFNALNEEDVYKQFLFYFHFLERYVHQIFGKLDHQESVPRLINIPERIRAKVLPFLIELQKEAKNLRQRFYWCTIHKWDNLDNDDIEQFCKIKKIRDKLSHGEEVPKAQLPNESIQKLIFKILRKM